MVQALGGFIKKIRTEKRLTQEEIAVGSGLARSYISRLEDDQIKSPSAIILVRLAKGLGVSHEAIFQVAGYIPKMEKTDLPSFDVYMRTKYPEFSEEAIVEIEYYKDFIRKKYKK